MLRRLVSYEQDVYPEKNGSSDSLSGSYGRGLTNEIREWLMEWLLSSDTKAEIRLIHIMGICT